MPKTAARAPAGRRVLLRRFLLGAAIVILICLIAIAIRPDAKRYGARNSQRQTDSTAILNAMYEYLSDNNGALPSSITNIPTEICATGATSCTGLVDLSALTTSGTYLVAIPKDPQCATVCAVNGTGYKISKDTEGHLIVSAPATEKDATIYVTR